MASFKLFVALFSSILAHIASGTETGIISPFIGTDKSYSRSIIFNRSAGASEQLDFIDRFNEDFFRDEEKTAKATFDDIEKFSAYGFEALRRSLTGFRKTKLEDRVSVNVDSVPISEPWSLVTLPNTSYSHQVEQAKTDGRKVNSVSYRVYYFNTNVQGMDRLNVKNMGYFTTDAEHFALFHITAECFTEGVTICGEHTVVTGQTGNNEKLSGKFCFELANVTYSVRYRKFRNADGLVQTSKLTEEFNFSKQGYKLFTFPSRSAKTWPALTKVHTQGLRKLIAEEYLSPISDRFRRLVERNESYLSFQESFLDIYRQRVSFSLLRLAQLYLTKLNDSLDLSTDAGDRISFRNFSNFFYAYPKSKAVGSSCEIVTQVYYADDSYDAIIRYGAANSTYPIKSFTLNVTVSLNDGAFTGVAEKSFTAANDRIEVAVDSVEFRLQAKDSVSIPDDIGNVIRSTIETNLLNVVRKINRFTKIDHPEYRR